jgi:CelD/BcsL family acetyltransferase involved in cellulose biosynthesis
MKFQMTDFDRNTQAGSIARDSLDNILMPDIPEIVIHRHMEPIEARWRKLETLDINSLHQGFDWCRAWIDAYKRPILIVEGRRKDQTLFILPLEIVRGKLFTKAQFIGGDHSNINTGLVSEEFISEASDRMMADIAAQLRSKVSGADCIVLGNMPASWRGHTLPFSRLPSVENQNHAFALEIKPTFVETLAQLNAKRRRKKYSVGHRRLEALGGYRHAVAETADEKRQMLDLFYKQKGLRLEQSGLPNVFSCPKTRKFFHSLAQLPQSETNFALKLHYLEMTGGDHKGSIPAIAGLSRQGDHVIVQFCSIGEDALLSASPGELLFHLMIEDYNSRNIKLFDFGIGDMPFKRSWCNIETIQINVALPLTSLGRLAVLKEEAATRLKSTIKQNPALYGFLQKIRSRNSSHGRTEEAEDAD